MLFIIRKADMRLECKITLVFFHREDKRFITSISRIKLQSLIKTKLKAKSILFE